MSADNFSLQELANDAVIVPPCATDIFAAYESGLGDRTAINEMMQACRLCTKRFTQHGWLDGNRQDGVWSGCAHSRCLRRIMSR